MAKRKTAFVCNDCGSDYGKWQGQCKECGGWNTLQEISVSAGKAADEGATMAMSEGGPTCGHVSAQAAGSANCSNVCSAHCHY